MKLVQALHPLAQLRFKVLSLLAALSLSLLVTKLDLLGLLDLEACVKNQLLSISIVLQILSCLV